MVTLTKSIVSSVAASLLCLQVQSTCCVCISHQRHYWFCFTDCIKNKGEVCWNVQPQTGRDLEELLLCNVPFTPPFP